MLTALIIEVTELHLMFYCDLFERPRRSGSSAAAVALFSFSATRVLRSTAAVGHAVGGTRSAHSPVASPVSKRRLRSPHLRLPTIPSCAKNPQIPPNKNPFFRCNVTILFGAAPSSSLAAAAQGRRTPVFAEG